MNKNLFVLIATLLLIVSIQLKAQLHISGFIADSLSGELLIGASIVEKGTTNGTSSDNNGYFSLITKGKPIQISFIGYTNKTISYTADTLVHIVLKGGEEINEVVVKGEQVKRFNLSSLSKKEMLSIPSIGGTPDVLKCLQLLPGIQSQQEGSSLLNVRGGNPGENLYLFDNIPIIYVNHLGGFTSVFNPDMINNIEVYKGGFPAKYGGKLSSVVAITQREGDKSGVKGSLGIGVTDASFSLEGPILNKKGSFIVTGRKTLIDPFMILASGLSGGGDYFVFYGFHDLNGKLSWHPNKKNSIYFNFYQGDDYIKYWTKPIKTTNEQSKLTNAWGNWLAALRWNRVISPRLFVDNTFSYTRYRLKIGNSYYSQTTKDSVDFKKEYLSSVQDISLRSDWQYKLQRDWSLDYGAKTTYLIHVPNKIYQSDQTIIPQYEQITANETSVYLNNRFTLFNFLDADIGGRLVNYHSGSFNDLSFEPRIQINAKASNSHTINLSYQKVNQYAHLVFTSGSIMNNEVWVPANEKIAPANSVQYSFGWKGMFFDESIQSEINFYYKELNQLSTYKEGYSNLMGDGGWRTKIETGGNGIAKGAEFLVRKAKGEWTGFIGYTFSKSTRQFPEINGGKVYLFDFDRPHSLSINANRQLSEKWALNMVWVYQTGLPYTPVIGRQLTPVLEISGNEEPVYSEALIYGPKNSARMKDYHRLDIGLTKTTITKRGRKAIWNYSVYNAYCRKNANAYFYGYEDKNWKPNEYKPLKKFQYSFFPIIPTISYKVFFDSNKPKEKTKTTIKQRIKNYVNYGN